MYSAITDFYQHTEKEVFSSRQIADKLQRELEHTLKQINFRSSADEILGLFSNVTLSLEDFAFRLNDLVKVWIISSTQEHLTLKFEGSSDKLNIDIELTSKDC